MENVYLSLLLLCHLELKPPNNGLNDKVKMHHIQMKRGSWPISLEQKLTPVTQ